MQYNKYALALALLASSAFASAVNFDALAGEIKSSKNLAKLQTSGKIDKYQLAELSKTGVDLDDLDAIKTALTDASTVRFEEILDRANDKITLTSRETDLTNNMGVTTEQLGLIKKLEAAINDKIDDKMLKRILSDDSAVKDEIEAIAFEAIFKKAETTITLTSRETALSAMGVTSEQLGLIKKVEAATNDKIKGELLKKILSGDSAAKDEIGKIVFDAILSSVDDVKLTDRVSDLTKKLGVTPDQMELIQKLESGTEKKIDENMLENILTKDKKTAEPLVDEAIRVYKEDKENIEALAKRTAAITAIKDLIVSDRIVEVPQKVIDDHSLQTFQVEALKTAAKVDDAFIGNVLDATSAADLATPPPAKRDATLADIQAFRDASNKFITGSNLDQFNLTEKQKDRIKNEDLTDDNIKDILEPEADKIKRKEAEMKTLSEEIWAGIKGKDIKTLDKSVFKTANADQINALIAAADLKDADAVLAILKNPSGTPGSTPSETEEEKKQREVKEAEAKLNDLAEKIKKAIPENETYSKLTEDVVKDFKLTGPQETALKNANPKKDADILAILKNAGATSSETEADKKTKAEKAATDANEKKLNDLAAAIKKEIDGKKPEELTVAFFTKLGATEEQANALVAVKDLAADGAILKALQNPVKSTKPVALSADAEAKLKELAAKIKDGVAGKETKDITAADLKKIVPEITEGQIKAILAAKDLKTEAGIIAALKSVPEASSTPSPTVAPPTDEVPFYKQTWFYVAAAVIGVAGIGGGVYMMSSRNDENNTEL